MQAELSVLITNDRSIQELNRDYRNIDSPTDVLSFSQDDPLVLGDIVISKDTALRQASDAGWSLASELALLATHGILHLMGHDDDSENGAQQMERLTRQILSDAAIDHLPQSHPFFQRIAGG